MAAPRISRQIAVLCVIAGGALGLTTACGSSAPYRPPSSGSAPNAPATGAPAGVVSSSMAHMGQPAVNGSYSFIVNQVQCGIGQLSGDLTTAAPAQGQFCVALVTMTNRANTPQDTPPDPKMIDANGNTFNTTDDISAQVAAQGEYYGSGAVQEQVNPGSHYSTVYVYDVPAGIQPAALTLYGDYAHYDNDNGVRVAVTAGHAQPAAPAAPPSTYQAPPAPPAPPAATNDAGTVVEDYFAAINAGDYAHAWALGGDNIENGSYSSFVQGFSGTSYDAVTILSVSGNTVSIDLDATQTDGTHKYFSGTYTVSNGVIVGADIH